MILRQSTAVDILIGPFVDEDDGKTLEESLTISQGDVMLSKNGQVLAQKNDNTACAFDDFGCYNCELDATDTDTVGTLTVVVFEDGALPFRRDYQVIEEAVYDIMFAGSATGAVPVASIANGAITAASIATGAIDADAIADNAIDAGAIAANAITDAKIATGAITSAKFAAGAIDAAAIAADAIGSSELAASAVTEIAAAIASPSINTTTIATLASQTSFTLTAGSADDNAYNGCIAVITDASTAVQKAIGVVLDYTGSTKTVTLSEDPGIFTMAVGDAIEIRPDRSLKPTLMNRTVDVDADGGVEVDSIQTAGLTAIADAILTRDWTSVTGEAARSVLNALRFLRNKRGIAGGTLTVTEEDDTTAAWTAAVTTTAGDPVSEVDPA